MTALSGKKLWTIAPNLRQRLRPRVAPPSRPWATTLCDPKVGEVRLRGELRERPDADALCVLVHGLGGTIDSHYMVRGALAVEAAGLSCLRLSLRGADRRGEDFYHAGLVDDLDAALASRALAPFTRIYLLGYSLGGHVCLRRAVLSHNRDTRLRAVASVCAPLELDSSCRAIDAPGRRIYRGHVLAGLREIYEAVAARREVVTPLPVIRRIKTIREWDRLTVVPRHGFDSVDHYYATVSVGPRLREATLPALVVSARDDPMIPPEVVAPWLHGLPKHVERRWLPGGHVGFSDRAPLGLGCGGKTVEEQILAWMLRQ